MCFMYQNILTSEKKKSNVKKRLQYTITLEK